MNPETSSDDGDPPNYLWSLDRGQNPRALLKTVCCTWVSPSCCHLGSVSDVWVFFEALPEDLAILESLPKAMP